MWMHTFCTGPTDVDAVCMYGPYLPLCSTHFLCNVYSSSMLGYYLALAMQQLDLKY